MQRYGLSTPSPNFWICIFFAFSMQTVCKLLVHSLCPDAQHKTIPFFGTSFLPEHLLVEAAAHRADGAHVAAHHSGDVPWCNAQFDEQARLVFEF